LANSELSDFGRRVEKIVGKPALDRMMHKAGAAGKKSALEAAADKLGGDRKFSGFRGGRGPALGAGYDIGGSDVTVNFRPGGMWKLAQTGRRSSGAIVPKKRGGRKAVLTPMGPRSSSSFGPSRGLKALDTAFDKAEDDVPKAFAKQFRAEVGRAMKG
jgi:hypothetical protein